MARLDHFVHESLQGERWDLLAFKYYGDAKKMGVIIEANSALWTKPIRIPPMVLPSGLSLIIPIIDDSEVDESGLPPWKRKNPDYSVAA